MKNNVDKKFSGDERWKYVPRQKICVKLIGKMNLPKDSKILDVGCGDGNFLNILKNDFKLDCYGVEFSNKLIKECPKTLKIVKGNVENKIPFSKKFFDVILAFELIEHLCNVDKFLNESNRVLKNNGLLIITTPNHVSWYNRLLFLIGRQPIFQEVSTQDGCVGAGFLDKYKLTKEPMGHIRNFNYYSITDILRLHGFEIIYYKGVNYEHFPNIISLIDRFFNNFKKLSSIIVVVAIKNKEGVKLRKSITDYSFPLIERKKMNKIKYYDHYNGIIYGKTK